MATEEKVQGAPPRWHALSPEEALKRLDSSEKGLTADEARRRLEEHGRNELRTEERRPWWRRLLAQFENILIIILIIAGALSMFLGAWVDAGAIFAVVLINAAIGFIQEGKAEKALESIKAMLSPQATVLRDGERRTISAEEVVPGDLVVIESGDRVPADMRLVRARSLRTQEAALTGESAPVDKSLEAVDREADLADRVGIAYASTLVVQGRAEGVVVATAEDTEIGRISEMIQTVEQIQTPLLRQLDRFGKKLAAVIVVAAAAMALFGVLVYGRDWQEMFLAAVGLAVAAIPQGLPAVITITLALGVQVMARRNAIVRRLPAVETLGSVSVIFSDKTGTLTRNEMTVTAVALSRDEVELTGVGFAPEGELRRGEERIEVSGEPLLRRFLIGGVLCNEATAYRGEEGEWKVDGDPTEGALVVAALKSGLDFSELRRRHERLDIIPFESERKYMATLDDMEDSGPTLHVKGAPIVILDMCERVRGQGGEEPLDKERWVEKVRELSSRGLRVLALAEKEAGSMKEIGSEAEIEGLSLLGLVGMLDPPRETAVKAVERCLEAGVRVKMVTGDHLLTAQAIGAQVKLQNPEQSLAGQDIEKMSDEELQDRVWDVDVYARASPEHKLRLVKAVQARKGVCAMTGDGVNDAPALKRADVGVAMGITGTEASKEAAEIVLADDNFASIVNAIEEGRKVYQNIKKTIIFLLPTNGGESLSIMGAVLFGTMLPITPVQILWVNMITAVTLGLALAFEPGNPRLMKEPPRDPEAPILDRFLVWRVFFVSVLLVLAIYGIFLWLRWEGVDIEIARSAAVNMLVMGEVVYLVNTRRLLDRSISRDGLLGSRAAIIAIVLVISLQMLWTYTAPFHFLFQSAALPAYLWLVIVATALVIFLLVELEKTVWRRIKGRRDSS